MCDVTSHLPDPTGLGPPIILAAAVLFTSVTAWAIVTDFKNVDDVHDPVAVHADQHELNALPADEEFTEAFELGDELFATPFNA